MRQWHEMGIVFDIRFFRRNLFFLSLRHWFWLDEIDRAVLLDEWYLPSTLVSMNNAPVCKDTKSTEKVSRRCWEWFLHQSPHSWLTTHSSKPVWASTPRWSQMSSYAFHNTIHHRANSFIYVCQRTTVADREVSSDFEIGVRRGYSVVPRTTLSSSASHYGSFSYKSRWLIRQNRSWRGYFLE